jgi:hypothetical protein
MNLNDDVKSVRFFYYRRNPIIRTTVSGRSFPGGEPQLRRNE